MPNRTRVLVATPVWIALLVVGAAFPGCASDGEDVREPATADASAPEGPAVVNQPADTEREAPPARRPEPTPSVETRPPSGPTGGPLSGPIVESFFEVVDVSDPIEVGSTQRYVIDVPNQGSHALTNVVVECTLARGQEFVVADAGGLSYTVKNQVLRFAPLTTLRPGERRTYDVRVRATAAGDVRFVVALSADQLDRPSTEVESTHQY